MKNNGRKFMFFVGFASNAGFYVNKSNETFCFGNNQFGQLNVGDRKNRLVPEVVEFFKGEEILNICVGWRFCVFRTRNRVVSCGSGENGKTSLGDKEERSIAEKVILEDEEEEISDVSIGCHSTFFLCSGRVYLAGSNLSGNRCYGLADDLVVGTRIHVFKTEIEKIVSGYRYALLFGKNEIFVGGAKHVGLGPSNNVLVKLDFFKKRGLSLSSVVPGAITVYFLCGNDVYISGVNDRGQYGNRTYDENKTNQPVLSTTIRNIESCVSGWVHFVWRETDGCCIKGRLGLGQTEERVNVPTLIPMPSEIREAIGQIAACVATTYFISKDGQKIYGTGWNEFGQLLNGNVDEVDKVTLLRTDLNLKEFEDFSGTQCDASSSDQPRERLEFVLDLQPDLRVKFNDTELEIFSSVLNPEARVSRRIKDGCVEVNRNLRTTVFDTDLLHSLVWGAEIESQLTENIQHYLDFFLFFNAMGMRQWEYAILKAVSRIQSLSILVKLFIFSFKLLEQQLASREGDAEQMLEQGAEEIISFESNFTLNIFNILAERGVDEIRKETALVKALERLRVWADLLMFRIRPIEKLVRYEGLKESSFKILFEEQTKVLYRHLKRTGNYVVVSADEKEIYVHRELLALKSDYFFRVMKFGGRETRKEGYLLLERLNFEELTIIVEFVYTKEVTVVENGGGLRVLMNVLEEIIPYQESALQACVTEKIFQISNSQIESGVFMEDGLSRIGHFVSSSNRTLPEEVKKKLYGEWEKKVEEEKLKEGIERSVLKRLEMKKDEEKRELEDNMRLLESKFEQSEIEMKEVKSKFSKVDERFDNLESEVSEMKGSIEDILKILQGKGERTDYGRGGRKRKTGSSRGGGKRRKKESK